MKKARVFKPKIKSEYWVALLPTGEARYFTTWQKAIYFVLSWFPKPL